MAGDAVVGALRVVLGMDTATFEDNAKQAAKVTESFGKQVLAVAGGTQLQKFVEEAAGALKDFIKDAIATGDELQKMSQRTGIPVSELSGLKVAAEVADLSVESLARGIKTLQVELLKSASKGATPAASALQFMGLTVKEIVDAKPADAIRKIADGFSQITDPASKAAAVGALFGKRFGTDLIPLLSEASEGIDDLIEKAQKLGLVISDEFGKDAASFADSMKLLGMVMKGIALQTLAPFIKGMAESKEKLVDWLVENEVVAKASEVLIRAFKFLADNATILAGVMVVLTGRFVAATIISFASSILTLTGRLVVLAATNIIVAASWLIWAAGLSIVVAGILLLTGTLDPFLKAIEDVYAKLSKGIISEQALKILKDAGFNVDAFTKSLEALGIVAGKAPVEIPGAKFDPEAAQKLQAFNNEILKLKTNAREVAGEFNKTLAPGFLQAAISAKIVHEDMSNLEQVLALADDKSRKLNAAMLELAGAKLTQDFQTPWQQFNDTIDKTNLLLQNNAKLAPVVAQAQEQAAYKMAGAYGSAAATIAGGFADAAKFIAEQNKKYAPIAKGLAIAQATANTFVAATKALADVPTPLNYVAAAAVTAAGLANVAKIAMTDFATGGSFKVGGSGGIDSQLVSFNATPGEMVDVRKPGTTGPSSEITIRGVSSRDFFTGDMLRAMVDSLNAAHSDGYKLKFAG